MFDSEEQRERAEVIVMTLAKLYVVLELSTDGCPLCRKVLIHDVACPIVLAWNLLDEDQQHKARRAIRALALSMGCDGSVGDPVTH
jgi:hypothetical protein